MAIHDVECEMPLPDAVAYYPAMEIEWRFSMGSGATWLDAGVCENSVYVTLGDPLTSPLYHTLAHLGCVNAAGETDEAGCTEKIWDEFTDLDVRRADGTQMVYWGEYALQHEGASEIFTVECLLQHADGTCGAWASLFRDILLCQSIGVARVRGIQVKSVAEYIGAGFYVKNWTENEDSELVDQFGIPGQGNAGPLSQFENHAVVDVGGMTYDPSYGKTFRQLVDWEDETLAYLMYTNAQGRFFSGANIQGILQTEFYDGL